MELKEAYSLLVYNEQKLVYTSLTYLTRIHGKTSNFQVISKIQYNKDDIVR